MKQGVQFASDVLGSARQRARVAPAVACAVIGADPRGPGRFRLHPTAPGRRPIAQPSIDHHGWRARANAIDMEQLIWRRCPPTSTSWPGGGYACTSAASVTDSYPV